MANNLSYDLTAPGAKKAITLFFIRLALVFTLWHITYAFLLAPQRIIDKPLNNILTVSVVSGINLISPTKPDITWLPYKNRNGSLLIKNNKAVFGIADNCNGLNLMFTYVTVIFLLPYPLKRKLIFSCAGLAIIVAANILRILALYYIYVYHNAIFDFSHHYLFTILLDILIFCGWLLFIQKKKPA